jgi:SpoVK/Ycf46/Vps4 family AAA+-type ATPase
VSEITFRENSFDSLVLEQEKKDLILAFSQTQIKRKDQFDDVISGKGRGIIMLLSGSPGIGKTLTAETVAEHMRVPLYSINASDLGSYAYEMQYNMSKILTMVASWNAVLLLDECDVYLEKRETGNVSRNSIVSVFLRMLEYYEGILFMTTNRVDTIDPAFESRIHLSLEYPNLTDASREQVWRAFFEPVDDQGAKAHELSDADIKELSKLNLNGRQIKNTIKMAKLLSWQREESLKMWHVQYVLKVQKLKNLSD